MYVPIDVVLVPLVFEYWLVRMDWLMLLVVLAVEQRHVIIKNMYQHFVQQHVKNFANLNITLAMIDMYDDMGDCQLDPLMLHVRLIENYHL